MNGNKPVDIFSMLPKCNGKSENGLNTIIILDSSQFVLQDSAPLTVCPETNILTPLNSGKTESQQNIFVCTFCQVFSSTNSAIVNHILEVHRNSLPSGVAAGNFVSKLQSLQGNDQTSTSRKVGRPRKTSKKGSSKVPKVKVVLEPIPRSDGLYWCDKCEKSFKKARQISRHLCAEEEDFEDSSSDCDMTVDYKMYMDVQPTPWSRKAKNKSNIQESTPNIENQNNSLLENSQSKVKLDWRQDPEYVPLFQDEKEKIIFENHINSIDYSCIDHLFVMEENETKGRRKKVHPQRSITSYSCNLCKKKMNSLTHIRMHCLTHTDVKPFTCPKCPYRSNTKGSLYTHMRTHTGSIYRCSHCPFQTLKRSHLLDHEETHSKVPQTCKMCKNSYKTMRTLVGHIRRCHDNLGGKKYLKSLTSKKPKDTRIKCKICQKVFKSQSCLELHNKNEHTLPVENTEDNVTITNGVSENTLVEELSTVSLKSQDNLAKENATVKDPYAEIVLNCLLQQKSCESVELYEDVFEPSSDVLTPSENLATNVLVNSKLNASNQLNPKNDLSKCNSNLNFNFKNLNPTLNVSSQLRAKSNLVECGKNLNFDILDECLRNASFADEVMRETYIDESKLTNACDQPFALQPSIDLTYTNERIIPPGMAQNVQDVSKDLKNEPKSAEIKLFEKCQRAPAYVCCVCQGIFICTATLKAHLKEHVNSSNSLMETAEEYEQPKITETNVEVKGVCNILQEPSTSSADNEKELEKLYSSSLDTIWYLPEVSVVLENDLSLFDAFLDDISNFSIPDKYEETDDLQV